MTSRRNQNLDRYCKVLPNGMYDTYAWIALKKCLKGYNRAKYFNNRSDMIYYAAGAQKYRKLLKLPLGDFPEIGMMSAFERADFAKYCHSETFGTEELQKEEDNEELEQERFERSMEWWNR